MAASLRPGHRTGVSYVAIDFGTTFSGYAFAFGKDDMYMNKNWGAEAGAESFKTPTCVLTKLYRGKHEFLGFGYNAQKQYAESQDGQDGSALLCLFDKFKMKLHKNLSLRGTIKIKDKRDTTEVDALLIFKMALKYMKDHFLGHVRETGRDFGAEHFMWVLTVPAIWNERAKAFMRKAAHQAGLIKNENSDNLVIALEPEAASLYCRELDITDFLKPRPGREGMNMKKGTVYMILDAGGGTVDITVHEVIAGGKVRELMCATGGAWGGTNVDAAFENLLEQIWGSAFIKHVKSTTPKTWWEIENKFEFSKRTVDPDEDSDLPVFPVSMKLSQEYSKLTRKNIGMCCDGRTDIIINDDFSLVLSREALPKLFMPTVDKVVRCLRDIMRQKETKNVEYIFMVGGFSACKYLINAVRQGFSRCKVLIPEDPAVAILKGAVKFGQDPSYIQTRVVNKTYGTDSTVPFVPGRHPPKKKSMIDGIADCEGVFEKFVIKGDRVHTGDTFTRRFMPFRTNSTRIKIELCESESDRALTDEEMYISDPDVVKLSTILLPLSNIDRGLDRMVEVKFKFGETEIMVEAVDISDPDNPGAPVRQVL